MSRAARAMLLVWGLFASVNCSPWELLTWLPTEQACAQTLAASLSDERHLHAEFYRAVRLRCSESWLMEVPSWIDCWSGT